jgi:sensor histidine kinase regulating citrate/malate metabolism
VTNKGEIARDVQLQLFKRSFSTKTTNGRGIGTYSMKLFGERYLDGNIGFNSSNGRTTFYIELPLSPAKAI